MDERPVTRYAKTADGVHIAYQIRGVGPLQLLALAGEGISLDSEDDEPSFATPVWREIPKWCRSRAPAIEGGDGSTHLDPHRWSATRPLDTAGYRTARGSAYLSHTAGVRRQSL